MADDLFYWVALSFVPGVGSVYIKRLLDRFQAPEAVFQASMKDLLEVEGLGAKVASEIRKGPNEQAVKKELVLVEKAGARLITLQDKDYPSRLRDIYDPPALLYLKGGLKEEDELAVSIVGSRKTTPYGRWVTEKISRDLVRHGVTIVSGMARGVDSVAHMGAIAGGGRTIAVLGCGVDVIYPSENRNLFTKIIEQGAVISEFPMGSPPEGGHFPKRNRIISGLSIGVIVVQASADSGSLITANYALEQGREVFAIPGNVGADGSRGTNRLIKDGAKLVESSEDILEEILPQWRREKERVEEVKPRGLELSEEERILYEMLGENPLHIDVMIRESGFEPGKVSSFLLNLELKGFISQWPGKCFSRKM
ncbi:MAG: DNA-protecting protein DprA [Deltaproteobacteria bacterium]|nr:DNA-protecting protein DprA [Deltaproteobacteria bacterium]MBM4322597.1 DNA-protecting protein DprA [Deltaproteobacteria bacterium]